MRVRFETKMTVANLYDFLLVHTYKKPAGWLSIIVGIAAIVLSITSWGNVSWQISVCYIFLAVIAFVYMPFTLYRQAKKQMSRIPMYRFPMSFEVNDEGIRAAQNERIFNTPWEEVYKVTTSTQSIVVYFTKSQAFVWPKKSIGDQYEKLLGLLNKNLDKKRMRVKA